LFSLEADVLSWPAAKDIVSVASVESVVSGSTSEGVVPRFDRVDRAYSLMQTETVVAGSSVKHIIALVASKFIVSGSAITDVVACRGSFFAKDPVVPVTAVRNVVAVPSADEVVTVIAEQAIVT
jgi:hypothetical protein